nr:hypothetical protein KXZ65_05085 [Pectobacterium sp. PL152]
MNITQRLLLIFSLMSLALISLVIVTLSLLSGFQSRAEYVQENTIPSFKYISQLVEKVTHWCFFYRHQTVSENDKLNSIEQDITKTTEEVKALNDYYLKNLSSNEEDTRVSNQAADIIGKLQSSLPAFLLHRA